MTLNASRELLLIFIFIMPMLCSSSVVDIPVHADPLQLSKEGLTLDDLDPMQLSEEDVQLDPVQLSEEDANSWQLSEGAGDYAVTAYGKNTCPSGFAGIFDEATCRKYRAATNKRWGGVHHWRNIQAGCFTHRNNHVWFNRGPGRTHGAFASVCKSTSGCPGGWPQIKDVGAEGTASSAITASRGDCAAKCLALSTCGSFKLKGTQECSFNTWAQSTTEKTAVEGDAYTCKKVFAETASGATACPSAMRYEVSEVATCKDAGAALGKKWGGASTWNNLPGGCSIGSGVVYHNSDAGIAKNGFSKLCTSLPPKNGAAAPPASSPDGTTSTTTPSLISVCSPGVCTKGKWSFYLSDTTQVQCKAKCEESRRYVPVPDGIQEDVYKFRQNGRFHSVTSKMSSASRKVKNINYRSTGGFFKDPNGKNWPFRDHFYVRWSGYIKITAAGRYTFNTRSDDGSRLYINDKQVVSNGGWHGMRDRRANVELTAGKHKFWAEMFEGGGGAGMEWKYRGPDTGNREIIVPEEVLSSSLAGSSVKVFNKAWKDFGMCQAYSYDGNGCVIYSSCTAQGGDKESVICEDKKFEWVEPSNLTTCKY